MPGKVFISYARANLTAVEPFLAAFREYGIPVWIDSDEIAHGDSIVGRLNEAIKVCSDALVFYSHAYENGPWTRAESQILLRMQIESDRPGQEGRSLSVVRLDDAPLPPLLQDRLWHRASNPRGVVEAFALRHGYIQSTAPSPHGHPTTAPLPHELPTRELSVKDFLNNCDEAQVQKLAQFIQAGYAKAASMSNPFRVSLLPIRGLGQCDVELMPHGASSDDREEIARKLEHCSWTKRQIGHFQDQLLQGGLGVFVPDFEIRLDQKIKQLDTICLGKDGLRDLLGGVVLRVWMCAIRVGS